MANSNIINAVFGSGICAVTTSAFRANYGMVLRFSGIDLPTAFEVDFSNYDVMGRDSITMIGQNGEVQIPDDLWDSGLNIYAYVYLHPTDDSGVTVYTVTIPVLGRPNRTEEEPTPHEQSVIEQAISALNDAVEQTAADVETTTANAQAAAQSEANAATSERSAAASAGAALASQNAAESASQSATQSASGAAESARNAALSASAAAESATAAQESAEQAERSVQSIEGDVERAERAAATATDKATEASASATAAAQSAQSAASAAQNAASSEQLAESHATDAEQAKSDAQDAKEAAETAQTAAEQAAESVSGLSAQIAQNTADIAELVQTKAGALIDTVSGSIASFYPDSTVPTIKGLTVNVEPIQDLHGYDNPWPAGGGKNLWGDIVMANDMARTVGASVNTTNKTVAIQAGGNKANMTGGFVFKENTQYTFIFDGTVSQYGNLMFAYTDGTNDRSLGRFFSVGANVSAPNKTVAGLYKRSYSNTTLIYYEKAGLFEGALTASQFSPYSNICPISGWDAVEVQRTAINVWDEEWELNGYSIINGQPVATNGIRSKNYNPCVPNTNYYVLGAYYIFWYDADKNYLSYDNAGLRTSPPKARFFRLRKDGVTTYNNDISINYPSTDTAYHSGKDNATYTIQLGQTVYGGTIDATAGKMVVDRAITLVTGSSSLAKDSDQAGYHRFYMAKNDVEKRTNYRGHIIANACPTVNNYANFGTFDGEMAVTAYSITSNPSNYLYIISKSLSTVAEVQAQFAEEPLQIVYELATPITVDLTPLEISVLTGQTNNIWADSGDVSVEYAADLKTYINQKIAAAVAALS